MAKHRRRVRKSRVSLYHYNNGKDSIDSRAFILNFKDRYYKVVGGWSRHDLWYTLPRWLEYDWEDSKWKPFTPELREKISVWLPESKWHE